MILKNENRLGSSYMFRRRKIMFYQDMFSPLGITAARKERPLKVACNKGWDLVIRFGREEGKWRSEADSPALCLAQFYGRHGYWVAIEYLLELGTVIRQWLGERWGNGWRRSAWCIGDEDTVWLGRENLLQVVPYRADWETGGEDKLEGEEGDFLQLAYLCPWLESSQNYISVWL